MFVSSYLLFYPSVTSLRGYCTFLKDWRMYLALLSILSVDSYGSHEKHGTSKKIKIELVQATVPRKSLRHRPYTGNETNSPEHPQGSAGLFPWCQWRSDLSPSFLSHLRVFPIIFTEEFLHAKLFQVSSPSIVPRNYHCKWSRRETSSESMWFA